MTVFPNYTPCDWETIREQKFFNPPDVDYEDYRHYYTGRLDLLTEHEWVIWNLRAKERVLTTRHRHVPTYTQITPMQCILYRTLVYAEFRDLLLAHPLRHYTAETWHPRVYDPTTSHTRRLSLIAHH